MRADFSRYHQPIVLRKILESLAVLTNRAKVTLEMEVSNEYMNIAPYTVHCFAARLFLEDILLYDVYVAGNILPCHMLYMEAVLTVTNILFLLPLIDKTFL